MLFSEREVTGAIVLGRPFAGSEQVRQEKVLKGVFLESALGHLLVEACGGLARFRSFIEFGQGDHDSLATRLLLYLSSIDSNLRISFHKTVDRGSLRTICNTAFADSRAISRGGPRRTSSGLFSASSDGLLKLLGQDRDGT